MNINNKNANFTRSQPKQPKLLDQGSFSCVVSPPFYEKPYQGMSHNDIGKIYKDKQYNIEELRHLIIIDKIDPNSNFTTKLKSAFPINGNLIRNNNIAKCLKKNLSKQQQFYQIVLENGGKNLNNYVDKNNYKIHYSDFLKKILTLIRGMIELQKNGLVHQDIKPPNILMNEKKISLINFGLMKRMEQIYTPNNLDRLNYFKHFINPPEYAVASIFINNKVNSINAFPLNEVYKRLNANLSKMYFLEDKRLGNKLRNIYIKGLIKFLNEIYKNNKSFSQIFNKDLAMKADVFSFAYVIYELNKHIIYKYDKEKIFVSTLYDACINTNPYKRATFIQIYNMVLYEIKRISNPQV